MSARSRRPGRIRAHRHEEARGDTRGAVEDVVVHVHVHRDDAAGPVAKVVAPEPRRRRPTLSGQLFCWRDHYAPVAARHHQSLAPAPRRAWWGLGRPLRHLWTLATTLLPFARAHVNHK